MPERHLGEHVIFWGYRAAERLACALPEGALDAVANTTGSFAWATMARRRAMVARHLRRVLGRGPEGSVPTRAAFVSYARYWVDTFRLPVMDPGTLDERARVEGLERVDAALEEGRGAIIALPHLGSWDQAGAWLTQRGYRVSVVMERLRPPRLLEWFVDARRRAGMDVIVRGDAVWEELASALSHNHLVGLVSDRDLSGRGVPVRFFGEETTLPAGPGRLARDTGAPVLPVGIYSEADRHWSAVVRSPLVSPQTTDERADVAEVTRQLAAELEILIRRAPTQWHLMQPNWPSDHR